MYEVYIHTYVCMHAKLNNVFCRLDGDDDEGQRRSSVISSPEAPELVTMPSRFEEVQQKGTIDVWWIYDDGGTYVCTMYTHAFMYYGYGPI